MISTQFCEKTGEFQEVIVINPDSIPGTKVESSTQSENGCDVVSKQENVILVSSKKLKRKVINETENLGKEEKRRKNGDIIYYNELADQYLKNDNELKQKVHDQSNKRPKKQAFQTSNLNNDDYKDQIISDRDDTAIKDLGYLACSVPGCKSICKKTEMKENLYFYTIIKRSGFELSRRQTGASADQWLKAIGRKNKDGSAWRPSDNSRICNLHFITGRPSDNPEDPDFVPSKFPTKVSQVLRLNYRF